jgi:hypothetical protein
MTTPSDERDLRDRFARLRRAEGGEAPSFARSIAARPREARPSVALTIAIAATLVLSVLFLPDDVKPTETIDLRSARWVAPTDFLLNVPGDWMLREVPRIAVPQIDTTIPRRLSS